MVEDTPTESDLEDVVTNWRGIMEAVRMASVEAEGGPHFRNKKPELVAVSKTKHPFLVKACYDAGQRKFGENYIQELEDKSAALAECCPEIQWHFIGRLQSNKANFIKKLSKIKNLFCVETIAEEAHAQSLNKEMEKLNRTLNIMVQVNTSDEEQKGGVNADKALHLAQVIKRSCPALKLCGFMTIGSFVVSCKNEPNEEFEKLFDVRKQYCYMESIPESELDLSMGMSHDFEAAIKQGSTSVRVGSLIFGARY